MMRFRSLSQKTLAGFAFTSSIIVASGCSGTSVTTTEPPSEQSIEIAVDDSGGSLSVPGGQSVTAIAVVLGNQTKHQYEVRLMEGLDADTWVDFKARAESGPLDASTVAAFGSLREEDLTGETLPSGVEYANVGLVLYNTSLGVFTPVAHFTSFVEPDGVNYGTPVTLQQLSITLSFQSLFNVGSSG